MPIQEYVDQPWNKKNEMFKFMANICQKKCEEEYLGFAIVPTTTSSGKESFIYCNADHANRLKATRDQASASLWKHSHLIQFDLGMCVSSAYKTGNYVLYSILFRFY